MAYVTKKPTGLKITRSGNEFTFSWNIRDNDHGAGQKFEYRKYPKDKWHNVAVTPKQTSVKLNIGLANAKRISFRVRGKRSAFTKDKKTTTPEMSNWAEKIDGWVAAKPSSPRISYSMSSPNEGAFHVEYDADTKGKKVALYVQWQTCTSKNNTNPPKSGWSAIGQQSGTADVSRDLTYTEQTEDISATGVVRWVRVRARGNGGTTDWKYARHAYSTPITPALKSASGKRVPSKNDTTITATWTTESTLLRPVDEETVQYMIGIPDAYACNPPAGGSWSEAITVDPSGKKDIVTAYVSDITASTDECMWVRIRATHDERNQYSTVKRVITSKLAKPAISATVNFETGLVTYTITVNTRCSVARHLLFWRDPARPDVNIPLAVLGNATTSGTIVVPGLVGASSSCIGVYEFVGTNSGLTVNAIMTSDVATDSDANVVEPDAPTLEQLGNDAVSVGFAWKWSMATSLDISYSDNPYAWESNKQPTIYNMERAGATRWIIQDLDVGKLWYFRLRYRGLQDNEEVVSDWSDSATIDLATTPETPTLVLNRGFCLPGGVISASWNYVNDDESPQDSAQVCFATVEDDEVTYGDPIAHAGAEQNVSVSFADATVGTTYYLAVRVRAASGRESEWSDPVAVYVPAAPTVAIGGTFLTDGVLSSLDGTLQLSLSTDNAPGRYSVSIVRAWDYHIDRPDDSVLDGFEGETIWTQSAYHEGGAATVSYTVALEDLVGALDDGAGYTIIATVSDDLGQAATASTDFTIAWDTQPTMPKVAVNVDAFADIALITVTNDDANTTDTFDVYRLSADQPELILRDCQFGVTYVDPYPALGKYGGHRIVEKSKYGDYITSDNTLSWVDVGEDDGDFLDDLSMIIDADGMQIRLPYNIELSHRWSKDFQRTSYLGGSVQGDWNPAVLRDMTAKTVIVKNMDDAEYTAMRDLASYAGPAHIRTPDGSSFACDIQIAEDAKYSDRKVSYSLTIKAIDPQEPEGMTLAEWNAIHPEE